jgi:hypothetical protein
VHRSFPRQVRPQRAANQQYCRNERRVAFPRDWNAGGSVRLNEKIAALKSQMAKLKEIEAELEATGETPISLTDPDARSMITRGSGINSPPLSAAMNPRASRVHSRFR